MLYLFGISKARSKVIVTTGLPQTTSGMTWKKWREQYFQSSSGNLWPFFYAPVSKQPAVNAWEKTKTKQMRWHLVLFLFVMKLGGVTDDNRELSHKLGY